MSGWTDERIAQLKSLWNEGLSATQVARVLTGVSRNAVIGKLCRLGLAGRFGPARPNRRSAIPRRGPPNAAVPPPPPPPQEPMPDPLRVPLVELQSWHCRFPLWGHNESGAPNFEYCGLGKRVGSYCEHHAVTVYGKGNVLAIERGDAARMERNSGVQRAFA